MLARIQATMHQVLYRRGLEFLVRDVTLTFPRYSLAVLVSHTEAQNISKLKFLCYFFHLTGF